MLLLLLLLLYIWLDKLETGEAVSKFPEESDQAGKRVEAAIFGTCPRTKTTDLMPVSSSPVYHGH